MFGLFRRKNPQTSQSIMVRPSAAAAREVKGSMALAAFRRLGWDGYVEGFLRSDGAAAGTPVGIAVNAVEKSVRVGPAVRLRPIGVAMFAYECATVIAHVTKQPAPVSDMAIDILCTNFQQPYSPAYESMEEAHRDTVALMFPDGFDAPMVANEDQLEWIWGVLCGNRAAAEFLFAMKAGSTQPTPSDDLLADFRAALVVDGQPMPPIRSGQFMKRAST